MARISFTAAANADTTFILDDLPAKAGNATVIKYRAAFEALDDKLEAFPDSGSPRRTIGANIRIGVVHPYIVIYRHSDIDSTVTVLRIVRGSRRITDKLLRGSS